MPQPANSTTPDTALSIPEGGLTTADLVVIVIYLAAMMGMGIAIARRQKSTTDFFLGGRSLPAWAVGISIFASLLSTITYLGMPGEMFRTGVAFLTRQLPIPLVLIVVWALWIPFFMRLNLTSGYEYLSRRFNYTVRALSAVFCLLLLFGWISVVVLTAAGALVDIAHLDIGWFLGTNDPATGYRDADMHLVIIAVGMFSILYTTLGGIRAVIWTDVIQFLVLMVGALFTMGYVAYDTGSGLGDWVSHSLANKHEQVEWFSLDVGNRSTVFTISVGMFFWFICTHGANQVALQRYFTVKSVREARTSYLVSALSSFGIGIILAGVGVSLAYYIQDHPLDASIAKDTATNSLKELDRTLDDARTTGDPRQVESVRDAQSEQRRDLKKTLNKAQDSIFPQFIRHYMPPILRGLVVAALFAAAMSTIDSGANSTSTILTVDFFRPLSRTPATEAGELSRARVLTATMGVVVVLYTLGLYHLSKGTNIIDLCQRGFNCFLGPLGATFMLGMFSRRVSSAHVIPAFVAGEIVGVCTSYSMQFFGVPFSTHLIVPAAWAATMIGALVLSLLIPVRPSSEQLRWTRKAVLADEHRDPTGPAGDSNATS
jgi:SSS family solute:Na+ symporter|tara:strand:+ start:814 stop:2616 length:1803 start_codon:yes stop_codon:yes gene_type:complete